MIRMRGVFSRLYGRGGRSRRSQLEDYLTEAFGSVYDRLDGVAKRSLLHALMDEAARSRFDEAFPVLERDVLATQVTLDETGHRKRPDMVLRIGGRDVLVIEAKLGAVIGLHTDPDASATPGAEPVTQTQLTTYSTWIAGRNAGASDAWPGAVVLFTAWTPPPAGFPSTSAKALESSRTWSQVAKWILDHSRLPQTGHQALTIDLLSFLKEKNLLDRHFDARDVATVTLYAASDDAFKHTTRTVMKALSVAYPALGNFAWSNVGVDGSIGAFMGWMYFGAALQPHRSRFWIGLGICGEPAAAAFDDDFIRTTGREPFVMVHWGDEYGRSKPIDHVSSLPACWIEMKIRPALIVTKPIREFAGEPEGRAEEIKAWACDQVGALTRVMKGHA